MNKWQIICPVTLMAVVVLFMAHHQAVTDDVPDDQEISGEVEFFDEREFFFDLNVSAAAKAGCEGIWIITIVLAFGNTLAEERVHGFAGRHWVFGELVAEVG